MASVQSLGIFTPSAIPFLVTEGILPPDPDPSLYTLQTSSIGRAGESEAIEELVYTENCVAWSRGGSLLKIYRFDVEKEPVKHAAFVKFEDDGKISIKQTGRKVEDKNKTESGGPSGISVPKQRSGFGDDGGIKSKELDKRKAKASVEDSKSTQEVDVENEEKRALVVALKSQAHIYYLSGTQYLVHLPFEVAALFPLPKGLMFQGKVSPPEVIQATPQMPPVPANSFAFSQTSSSGVHTQTKTQEHDATTSPAVRAMLESVFNQQLRPSGATVPVHFFLRDPLAELGLVVEHTPATLRKNTSKHAQRLDPAERILHVSVADQDSPSVILAVSANMSTGQYSVWRVKDIESPDSILDNRRISTANSGAVSRRRSSFGPGTGATTPATRNSMGPRESFGHFKESLEDSMVQDDQDLATHLDPGFDHIGGSLKSSRRISSLLARSELSGSRDTSNLADLTSGHTKGSGMKRGPSFGATNTRKSFGLTNTVEKAKRNFSAPHTNDQKGLHEILDDNEFGESDSDDLGGVSHYKRLTNDVPSLKHELAFSRIYSFGGVSSLNGPNSTDSASSIRVFRLEPAIHTNSQQDENESVLCIMDHSSEQFYILHIAIKSTTIKKKGKSPIAKFDVKVTDVKRGQGVLDACKVNDGVCSRALVLSSVDNIDRQLSLQSPWGVQALLVPPSQYLINDPFQLGHVKSSLRKRDGSFKRVLSQGPGKLKSLHACGARGQFELWDEEGTKHCLQVNMRPTNTLVLRAIQACEFVLQVSDNEREPLQRTWWDIMQWLGQRQSKENLEWKAFLVLIFSQFVGQLDQSRQFQPPRTKRRSGGLLRSSSGANMDLEDFNEMMKSERAAQAVVPSWMQQNSWSWMLEQPFDATTIQPLSSSPPTKNSRSSWGSQGDDRALQNKKLALMPEFVELAKEFVTSETGIKALGPQGYLPTALSVDATSRDIALPTILLALHLLREELKLDVLASEHLHALTPLLAQLGGWLGWDDWGWQNTSFYMLESVDMERLSFDESSLRIETDIRQPIAPPSILEYVETVTSGVEGQSFPTLVDVATSERSKEAVSYAFSGLTPRTQFTLKLLKISTEEPWSLLDLVAIFKYDLSILDTFPEGVAAPLRSSIASCQANPGINLSSTTLDLIDRQDISMLDQLDSVIKPQFKATEMVNHEAVRDYHTICKSTFEVEQVGAYDGSSEIDRQAVTRMIFKEDQRFAEATKLVHPMKRAVAKCYPEEDWSDTDLLEAQQEVAKVVAIRTLSVSPGRGMLFYSARFPLLTEKFPIHGFSLSCIMRPTNTIVTADKNIYTEEKVSWAFFHAGVEAGLSISKDAQGIDTSWILFNKPPELTTRHAGFLLALGLNGHLKNIAKWVAFKYLTPKHTMTSIGLLLGLSASYLGTMDTLITRLLSVHVTRMLPPGAAELNLSPLTQTTGIMAIGLLYCNTQHRRMSEIMLSEMENIELDDTNNPLENLRDEGYRLSAGFALGYINLGQGNKMSGLRDMRIVERLLALAVATKQVDIVHILDKATAAATIATALIFMKTEDEALAKKIDIPDTTHQFVYVRPDLFLLRTVARHLIMWQDITPEFSWIKKSLPPSLQDQYQLGDYKYLHSEQLPLFNIVAGLCLSLGLRFAGTARQDVRDLLGHYLDCFMKITNTAGLSYDERLTRTTARNCQDVVALAAASVMAGTGDVYLFRRFRILHSRTDPDTPYGSHLAAHQAIGVLFLGGGTHTFNTSNLAVASLLCAFYPLFPTSVLDNKSHLQAFRHFWVLASEPRCLVVRAVETRRPINMPITIVLDNGKELEARAPCLLPSLDSIARIQSQDPQYWPVVLDFSENPSHRAAFARHQSMFVRRRGVYNASATVFGTTIRALNDAAMSHNLLSRRHSFEWIFSLPSFAAFDRAERTLVLPADGAGLVMQNAARSTAVDTRLVLERGCLESGRAERLWDLRVLFSWAERVVREKRELNWLGKEVLDGLRAKVALMGREAARHG